MIPHEWEQFATAAGGPALPGHRHVDRKSPMVAATGEIGYGSVR
jgi:hypothetical protein